jgi:type VI protein secretion system component VasF
MSEPEVKRRLKDIEDHLERADARYERLVRIQAIERANKDRSRRIRVAVAIFALICAAYAIAASGLRQSDLSQESSSTIFAHHSHTNYPNTCQPAP